jgi:hypothetical protein
MSQEETTKISKRDEWLDSRLLKSAGIVIALLSPLFAWIIVEIFSLKAEQGIIKEKINVILEIKSDISSIKSDIQQLKLDVNTLKVQINNSRGTP